MAKKFTDNDLFNRIMVVCHICGNKRCPKANDKLAECTDPNELNQKGSIY